MNSRQVTLSWIIIGILALSANANAGGRMNTFLEFLGMAKKAKPQHQADELHTGDRSKMPYEQAVARGEIFPAEFAKAQDAFHQPKYGNLFSSFQSETLVRTVGQEEAADDILTTIEDASVSGWVAVGNKGSGRSQAAGSIEYAFRQLADELPAEGRSYVIKIDTTRDEFTDFTKFKGYARALMNDMPELNDADTVVFYFDDLSTIAKQADLPGGSAIDTNLEQYIAVLEDMSSESTRVRIGLEMDEAGYEAIIKGTNLESRFPRVNIKSTDNPNDVAHIIEAHLPLLDKNGTTKIGQDKVAKLVTWVQQYLPDNSHAETALTLIKRAQARRTRFLKYHNNSSPDEYVRGLEKSAKKLQARLDKVGDEASGMQGAFAREERANLPAKLKQVNDELIEAEKEYKALVALRDKIKAKETEIAAIASDTPQRRKLAEELEKLMDDAEVITERDLALEVSRRSGATLDKVLKHAGRMTIDEFDELVDESLFGVPLLNAMLKKVARQVEKATRTNTFHPFKPIARILLTGPPGTGKTEVGRILSQFMDGYYRIDGADFKEKAWLSRLFGSSPGYKDAEKGGALVNHVADRPSSVVHWDEPELAHGELMDPLQKAMDPGGVTDNLRTVPTNRTVQIVSTNAVQEIPENFNWQNIRDFRDLLNRVSTFLSRPLLSRFNIIHHVENADRLGKHQILQKSLRELNEEPGFYSDFIKVDLSESAREHLINIVEETTNGTARDIQNILQEFVKDPTTLSIMESGYYLIPGSKRARQIALRQGDTLEFHIDEAGRLIPRILP